VGELLQKWKVASATKKGSFWWRDLLKLVDVYKGMASSRPLSGSSVHLWEDMWDDILPKLNFPELFSFARNKSITLQKAVSLQAQLHRIFHIPLSEEAFTQYVELQGILSNLPRTDDKDRWEYIWGSGTFSCPKAYKHLKGQMDIHPAFNWLWNSSCQLKHKIFFWLLLQNKLSTRGVLRRRNMTLEDYGCAICGTGIEESVEHLFLKCTFAVQCWNFIRLNSARNREPLQLLESFRSSLQVPFSWKL
jgi:hypothetical protein